MATPKQQDIAKILNVSRITVSKALRDAPDISKTMKKRVRQVAEELGYVPNFTARNLQLRKTFTVGVVVPDIANSFFSLAIHGIMDAASKHDYQIILTASRENANIEKKNIMNLLSMRVDGLLVAVSRETTDGTIFNTVKKQRIPLVFFDRSIRNIGFSSIGIDDRKAAENLVDFVISKGYTKIAHIAGSMKVNIGKSRYDGFVNAMKKHSIAIHDEWIIEGAFDKISGYESCKKLLSRRELPEVIFAVNDRAALGAYRAIREAGLQIPRDIGFVAFGHSEFAEILHPTLTIIDCPPKKLGEQAIELLISELNDMPSQQNEVFLPTKLIINESLMV